MQRRLKIGRRLRRWGKRALVVLCLFMAAAGGASWWCATQGVPAVLVRNWIKPRLEDAGVDADFSRVL